MSAPIAYGIDFGTSNSAVAAYLEDDTTEVVDARDSDGSSTLPSLVYLDRGGTRAPGTPAAEAFLTSGSARTRCRGCSLVHGWHGGEADSPCRQARPSGFCMDARLIHQVKTSLADVDFSSTHSWGEDFSSPELVAVVLRRLKRTADQKYGADVRRVAVGHPVRFSGAEGPGYRTAQDTGLERLAEAAGLAGFDEVELVPESQAATAVGDVGDGFAVFADFGGGTFDCAVADIDGDDVNVLALGGVPVGGEEYDSLLFDAFVSPVIGLERDFVSSSGQVVSLPARLRRRMRNLSGLRGLLTDPDLVSMTSGLRDPAGGGTLTVVDELLYGGQAFAFYKSIERAKVDLSSADSSVITFRRPWLNLNIPITRQAFESLVIPSFERVRSSIHDALAAAQVRAEDVQHVTRTGGSSQIPAFTRLLEDEFPRAELIETDPFTSVVTGLAEYAGAKWGTDD